MNDTTAPSRLAPPRRPRRRRRSWLLGLFVLLAAAGGGSWYFAGEAADPAEQALATATVTRGDLAITLSSLGTLQPKDYVDVGAQASGQIQAIHVTYGSEVKEGDLLAEIDPKLLRSRVDSDRAQLNILEAQQMQREAELELARQQHERNARLFEKKAVSEDVYQTGAAAVAVAEAAIYQLQAQIEQARSTLEGDLANLEYTKIYAPMDGTVVSIDARLGQTLNANQLAPIILRIADLATMTVWADVAEADVVRIEPGMGVHFVTLGEPDRRWQGTVRQILPTPEVVNEVVLYNVLIDVANEDRRLMTQMTAQVFFEVAETTDALLLPRSALRPLPAGSEGGGGADGTPYLVSVLTPAGPQERQVAVGLMDRSRAEVLSGLEEGDIVVLPSAAVAGRDQGGGRRFSIF